MVLPFSCLWYPRKKGKDEVTMTKASDNFILQPVFSKRSMTSSVRVITGNTLVIGALKKLPPSI